MFKFSAGITLSTLCLLFLSSIYAQDAIFCTSASDVNNTEDYEFQKLSDIDISDQGILALATDQGIYFYDLNNYILLSNLITTNAQAISWSPSGNYIAAYTGVIEEQATVEIWQTEVPQLEKILTYPSDIMYRDQSVSWSPDGAYVVLAGGWRNTVWDVNTGEIVFQPPALAGSDTLSMYYPHRELFSWSSDSHFLATPDEQDIKIWDTTTWEQTETVSTDFDNIFNVRWSRDNILSIAGASYYDENTTPLKLIDISTWRELNPPQIAAESIGTSEISPDGTELAVGTTRFLLVWRSDTSKWDEVFTLQNDALIIDIDWWTDEILIARTSDNKGVIVDVANECLLKIIESSAERL